MNKNQEHTKLYLSEGVKLLYNNALPGILITFITSSTLAFSFVNPNNLTGKLTWWALMMTVLIVRLIDTQSWVKSQPLEKENILWIARFSTGCLLTAAIWSAYVLCFYHTFNTEEFAATVVIICAMAGGATSVLSGNLVLSSLGNDSNLLIVFYVQIMPDDFVMQLHRF